MNMRPIPYLLAAMLMLSAAISRGGEDSQRFAEQGLHRIVTSTITETSATLLWWTEKADRGEVSAWTQDGKVVTVSDQQEVKEHRITLSGLQPDAYYHYVVKSSSGRSYVHHFRTVASLGDKPDFIMAIVADPQFDDPAIGGSSHDAEAFRHTVEAINQQELDLVLLPGDLVNNGLKRDLEIYRKNYVFFKSIADNFKMPWHFSTGNHEYLDTLPDARKVFRETFGNKKEFYSMDMFGRHFIFLDCMWKAGWKPDAEQMTWLKQDLESNRKMDVFVILHYAVANDPYVFDGERGVMPELQKLLESHGRVRAVYNGHKNVISATVQSGILYVNSPQPAICPSGYLTVKVYPTGLIQTFYNTPGEDFNNLLEEPRSTRGESTDPEGNLRWDCHYRWGEVAARNFTWRYGDSATSTGQR